MDMQRTLSRLKATHLIPPLLALALVGIWNFRQMRSISSLERDGAELRQEIAAVESEAAVRSSRPEPTTGSAAPAPIDWKQLPAAISDVGNRGETAQLKALIEFQQRLKNMTREELIAALDEVEALDLTADQREEILEMILESMIKLDPQYVLDRFANQIESDSNGVGWQLADAFGQWAKKDRAGATAWFDRQIAEGNFESRTLDGKSEMRAKFESEVLETLLATDLNEAGRRLMALPEDQRREVLEELSFAELGSNEQLGYASLVRQLVPADERAGSFANVASQLVNDGGYEKVSAFLDAVQATPEERAVSAKQAAMSQLEMLAQDGEITRAGVDSLRTWLDKQAPGQTDKITGKALAEAAQDDGEFDFDSASEWVLDYQKKSGNDDVLTAFLDGYSAHSNLEEAQALIGLISDPVRRQQFLDELK